MNITIIFDWKRTLYNPEQQCLIEGVEELLLFLKSKGVTCLLIGKGDYEMHDEVERLEINQYFKHIIFDQANKTIELFQKNIPPEITHLVVVGDRVRSEIEIGNKLGATTIWLCQGKFSDEQPLHEMQKPMYRVYSLGEIKKIIQKMIDIEFS